MGGRRLAWLLLAASCAVNVYLLAQARRPTSRKGAGTHASVARDESGQVSVSNRAVQPSALRGKVLSECVQLLPPLLSEVAQLSKELRRVLPSYRIFQLGEVNHDAEAIFRPIVERALTLEGGAEPAFTLECRDVVCRLVVIEDHDADVEAWRGPLRDSIDLRERVTSRTFHGSSPAADLLGHANLREERTYFRIVDTDAGDVGMVQ
jgi:hypothetical protein